MELDDICEVYNINKKNELYCLNDIARRILHARKSTIDDIFMSVKDKKKWNVSRFDFHFCKSFSANYFLK